MWNFLKALFWSIVAIPGATMITKMIEEKEVKEVKELAARKEALDTLLTAAWKELQ